MRKIFTVIGVILALAVAGITAAGVLYRPESRIPEGFAGRYVEVDGMRLRVLQMGSGPDVLLIHGCPGSIEDWTPLMELLAKNHRVTAYDRPGHGFSAVEDLPYTVEHNAQTARALIKALGLEDMVVVGHSYGASTALAMALDATPQVKSYVLVGSVPYGVRDIDPLYRLVTTPVLGTGITRIFSPILGPNMVREGLKESFGPNAGEIPPGFVDLRIRLWTRTMVALSRAHEILNFNENTEAMAQRYGDITTPVIVVEGSEDAAAADAYRLHEEIPASVWVEMSRTGHYVPIIRAQELAAVIDRAS